MSAETADNAGTPQLRQFLTVNTNMFRHPKYYKELRKRNKPAGMGRALSVDPEAGSDQVISKEPATAGNQRAPGPGLKHQASSTKLQASSQTKTSLSSETLKQQAASVKS